MSEHNYEQAKTLYVSRRLKNAEEFVEWAKDQGFKSVIEPNHIHTTIAFSRQPVLWSEMGDHFDEIRILGDTPREVVSLGDKGAVVLRFESSELTDRWKELLERGASWDWPGFKPHITITYNGDDLDLSKIKPFEGELIFGPEHFEEVEEDWEKKIVEEIEDNNPMIYHDLAYLKIYIIQKRGSKWCVVSKDGSRNLGCYPTKEEAEDRLVQIERIKAIKRKK